MSSVGRNDPCPCGSGKKFKRCHLLVEEARPATPLERAQAMHRLDQRLVGELLQFGRRRFPRWNPPMEFEEIGGNSGDLPLFVPWAAYQCPLEGRPLVEWFCERPGLPADERAWLAAQQKAWLSVWEVLAVVPGERL